MSAYRPGNEAMFTNVAGLNGVPQSEFDMALQHQQNPHHQPGYDFQADLDMFTNTQFFDLDMGEVPESASPASRDGEGWAVNRAYMADRQVPNFNNYESGASAGASYAQFAAASSNPSSATSPSHNDGRLASDASDLKIGGPHGLEEASRMAAEEDKRRRNTAASARFRVKKKQREQALEKTAKDMTDRVTWLENRVTTLEMENKLLKDLITEMSGLAGAIDVDSLPSRPESLKDRDERRRNEVKIESAESRR